VSCEQMFMQIYANCEGRRSEKNSLDSSALLDGKTRKIV